MYYIYRITNLINGKTYIGQRKCPKNKTPETDKYMGSGKRLRLAYKKYGIENFTKTIINKNIQTKPVINTLELYYIKKEIETKGKDCYNLLVGAHWTKEYHTPWNKGKKLGPHTDEWKVKNRGRTPWNKDKHMTDEWKVKHPAVGNNGLPKHFDRNSEEYQKRYGNRTYNHEKLSVAHRGHTPWNKGKKMSAEYCMKVSEAMKRCQWFNNGVVERRALTCPNGFVPGRITNVKRG